MILGPSFARAEVWIADIMETHLAYPVLAYFRSTHDYQSWVGTIGAFLDASTLVITTVDVGYEGAAKMLSRLGRHLVSDYTHYYGFEQDLSGAPGIERAEFDQVYTRLAEKGLRMREIEEAWTRFFGAARELCVAAECHGALVADSARALDRRPLDHFDSRTGRTDTSERAYGLANSSLAGKGAEIAPYLAELSITGWKSVASS